MKIALQIDFDGTVTEEDVGFLLLDTYADSRWREHLKDYTAGKISVGAFNRKVFATVKAGRQVMTDFVLNSRQVKIRTGFRELVEYCSQKGWKAVIVSNGLIFYIEAVLEHLKIDGLDIYAAENEFHPGGMRVRYVGPDGAEIEVGYKEAYTGLLEKQGYSVIYVGNGTSDIYPARRATRVFATGDLLERCRKENLACTPFDDFYDVISGLEIAAPD